MCEIGETSSSCPIDCGELDSCGDKVCSGNESVSSCPVDCSICGDNVCSGSENSLTCAKDCFNQRPVLPISGVAPGTVNTFVFILIAFSLVGMGVAAISIILHRRKVI